MARRKEGFVFEEASSVYDDHFVISTTARVSAKSLKAPSHKSTPLVDITGEKENSCKRNTLLGSYTAGKQKSLSSQTSIQTQSFRQLLRKSSGTTDTDSIQTPSTKTNVFLSDTNKSKTCIKVNTPYTQSKVRWRDLREDATQPSTPSSILRTELNVDNPDESLLCSPSALATPSSYALSLNLRQKIKESTTRVDRKSSGTRKSILKSKTPLHSSLLTKYESITGTQSGTVVHSDFPQSPKVKRNIPFSESSPSVPESVKCDKDKQPSLRVTRQSPALARRRSSFARKCSTKKTPVSKGVKLFDDLEQEKTSENVENSSILTATKADAGSDTKQMLSTPYGICLDLSNMFYQADSTKKLILRSQSASTNQIKTIKPSDKDFVEMSKVKSDNDVKGPVCNDDWIENQCKIFTQWLNFTFYPNEAKYQSSETSENISNHSCGSLRDLLLHQKLAQARQRAIHIYQSPDMLRIRTVLQNEISRGRLKMRPDRQIHVDLLWRKNLTSMLLSYSTPWLRLGIETMFRTTIAPEIPHCSSLTSDLAQQEPSSSLLLSLKAFILKNFLSDEKTLAKYTKGKCKIPSGKFEAQYQEEIRQVVLLRILVLIFFLDQIKQLNLLDNVPCLFNKNGSYGSSRDLLLSFCRDFLWGQGDFTKSLSRLGLSVSYEQSKIDELNFAVSNFAVDLRDGIRLIRLVEILLKQPFKSLLRTARLPAVSRLQKLHNVQLILQKLQAEKLPIGTDIAPHHIVDGHREMVLHLMWAIVSTFSLEVLVKVDHVLAEIRRIEARPNLHVTSLIGIGTLPEALLCWCKTVCAFFDETVTNITSDMVDGRKLCLIIHFYHPALLPMNVIKTPTSSNMSRKKLKTKMKPASKLSNSELASQCLSELGGMPLIIPRTDSKSPPDSQSMTLCLAYMFNRLLSTSVEVKAAMKLQRVYRRVLAARLQAKKNEAARIILSYWQQHEHTYRVNQRLKYGAAVGVIEKFFSKFKQRIEIIRRIRLQRLLQCDSAMRIQASFRRHIAQSKFRTLLIQHLSSCMIQCRWRIFLARRQLQNRLHRQKAVIKIQVAWRWFKETHCQAVTATIQIQRIWRGFWAQLQFQIDLWDIITVQNCIRKYIARKHKEKALEAVVTIQSAFRCVLAQQLLMEKQFLMKKHRSATIVQRNIRSFLFRRDAIHISVYKIAIIKMQSFWRSSYTRKQFKVDLSRIILIQAQYRSIHAMRLFQNKVSAVIKIQSQTRSYFAVRKYILLCKKTITLQSLFRRVHARKRYQKYQLAAMRLQQVFRVCIAKRLLQSLYEDRKLKILASICMQRYWRGIHVYSRFKRILTCIITLQSFARVICAKSQSACLIKATVKIQTFARIVISRRILLKLRNHHNHLNYCSMKIQSSFRRFMARSRILVLIHSVRTIQKLFRYYQNRTRQKIKSATVMQCVMRRYCIQNRYIRIRRQVLVVQSCCRQFLARKILHETSSRTIQALFRGFLLRRELSLLHKCATMVQKHTRRLLATSYYKDTICDIKTAQSAIRRWLCINLALERFVAIIRVQCWARMLLAKKAAAIYNMEKLSAICLQCSYRRYRAKLVTADLQNSRNLAIVLQKYYRGCVARQYAGILSVCRKENIAACIIQKTIRGIAARVEVALRRYKIKQRLSVLCLQRNCRRFLSRCYVDKLRDTKRKVTSAALLQRQIRNYILDRKLTRLYCCWRLWTAALAIQCQIRTYMARKSFAQKLRIHTEYKSAILIQSKYRGYVARVKFNCLLIALVEEYAAINIQRIYNGFKGRCKARRESAARMIQKSWRCYVVHVNYLIKVLSTIRIQRQVRRFACEEKYAKQKLAILRLQSFSRYVIVKLQFIKVTSAATCIQSIFRRFCALRYYHGYVSALVRVQKIARGWLCRLNIEIEQFAAVEIQRIWRGYYHCTSFVLLLLSVVKIQSAIRRCNAEKKLYYLRAKYIASQLLVFRCATKIQRQYRVYVFLKRAKEATCIIQVAIQRHISHKKFCKLRASFVSLQSLFRGYMVRRLRQKIVVKHALRVKKANLKAKGEPELRLGRRAITALTILQTSKSLSEIMTAVCTLEIATRYSQICCITFTHANAADILFSFIRSCNRSLPHIELLHAILLTLTNVARYEEGLTSLASKTGVEIFLDLVQMFRDKDNVFCLAVSLLEQVVETCDDFLLLCKSRENLKRLKGVYALCVRKFSLSCESLGRNALGGIQNGKLQRVTSKNLYATRNARGVDLWQGVQTLQRIISRVERYK